MSELYFGRTVVIQKVLGTKITFAITKPERPGVFEVDFADPRAVLAKLPTTVRPVAKDAGMLYCTEKIWSELGIPISRHDPFEGGNKAPSGDSVGEVAAAPQSLEGPSLPPAQSIEEALPPPLPNMRAAGSDETSSSIMYAPVQTVTLDVVRDGDADGIPLSRKTNYLVLCGPHPCVRTELDLDHAEVIDHLTKRTQSAQARLESTNELRATVTKFLAKVKGWHRDSDARGFVHLRLVFSPRELGLLPFELVQREANGPSVLVDQSEQTILTREIRHGPRVNYVWPSRPKVLFAWASSSARVLHAAHKAQLERALKPWAGPRTDGSFEPDYSQLLTTIDEARLARLDHEIKNASYTHVHLLAHGVPLNTWRDPSFGIALRGDEHGLPVVARGQEIVNALTAPSAGGPSYPSVVTLGSCDSAHMGDVAAAESSVAHALHRKGLPFVMGLQFGINSVASANIFGEFYRRILLGEDPRISMFHARQRAQTIAADDDWASLVAYASLPEDLHFQAGRNALKAVIGTLDAATEWADEAIVRKSTPGMEIARSRADEAIARLAALEEGWKKSGGTDKAWRAEHLGARGSAFKRRAELAHRWGEKFDDWLKQSRNAYREAFEVEVSNHWVGVQSLSVTAMLSGDLSTERQRWMVCEYIAQLQADARVVPGGEAERAWAHGSLVELYLLEPLLAPRDISQTVLDRAYDRAMPHLIKLNAIATEYGGRYIPATRRQLERYANRWCFAVTEGAVNQVSSVAQRLLNQLNSF